MVVCVVVVVAEGWGCWVIGMCGLPWRGCLALDGCYFLVVLTGGWCGMASFFFSFFFLVMVVCERRAGIC